MAPNAVSEPSLGFLPPEGSESQGSETPIYIPCPSPLTIRHWSSLTAPSHPKNYTATYANDQEFTQAVDGPWFKGLFDEPSTLTSKKTFEQLEDASLLLSPLKSYVTIALKEPPNPFIEH